MLGNWEGEQREGGWGSLIRAWVDFTRGGGTLGSRCVFGERDERLRWVFSGGPVFLPVS